MAARPAHKVILYVLTARLGMCTARFAGIHYDSDKCAASLSPAPPTAVDKKLNPSQPGASATLQHQTGSGV
jgi:hypothetical protein